LAFFRLQRVTPLPGKACKFRPVEEGERAVLDSSAADSPPENLTSRVAEDLDARLWLRDIAG
jgi:hypothetical protein